MQEGTALRPLGVLRIVDRAFGIYRSRPLMFLAIAEIPYVVLALFIGALAAASAPLLGSGTALDLGRGFALDRLTPAQLSLAAYFLVIVIAALTVTLVQGASLIDAVAARNTGRETTVGSALGSGLRASFRLLAMGLLAWLAFIVIGLLAAVIEQWWPVPIVASLAAWGYLAASWMVAPAVAILERAGPVAALGRSWALSAGNRWRILGLILLLGVVWSVYSALLLPFAMLLTDQLSQAIVWLAIVALTPVYWGTVAVLYSDLRVRREAFDLQVAAEAPPRAT